MKFKNILKVGGWTLGSRVLGLARDMLLARYLGAGLVSDAFFVALKIPNLFRRLFAEGSMQAAFVPIFSNLMGIDEKRAKEFAIQTLGILFVSLLIFVVFLEIFAKELVLVISPGFVQRGEDAFNLTVLLVRLTLPYLFLVSLSAFYSSLLNTLGRFSLVAFLPAFLNIAMIASLAMGFVAEKAAVAVSIGVSIGGVLQLLLVIYACHKHKWFLLPRLIIGFSKDTKEFFKKIIPVVVGAGVYQINIIIDVLVASLLPAGVISYLFYADRIYQLPLAMIGIAIGTVLLPALSNKATFSLEQRHNMKENAIIMGLGFASFAMVGIIALHQQIIEIIFYGGDFGLQATKATATILLIYALSLPANILVKVILPLFYAEGNTKTPFYITLLCLGLNLILVFLLAYYYGYVGIATATVVASYFNIILLCFCYAKQYGFVFSLGFKKEIIKIMAIAMGLLLFLLGIAYLGTGFVTQGLWFFRFFIVFLVALGIMFTLLLLRLFNSHIYKEMLSIFTK